MSNPQETPNASSRLDRGENHDVTELHAAVLREKPDPVEGFEPVNLWVVAGIAGLLFWGGAYLTQYSGRFESMEFSEFPHGKPAPVAAVAADPLAAVKRDGMIAYNAVCALCHGEDGAGKAGVAPPLAGSDWVNADGPNRLLRIVRHGLKGTVKVNKDVTWNPANDADASNGGRWVGSGERPFGRCQLDSGRVASGAGQWGRGSGGCCRHARPAQGSTAGSSGRAAAGHSQGVVQVSGRGAEPFHGSTSRLFRRFVLSAGWESFCGRSVSDSISGITWGCGRTSEMISLGL